MATLDEIRLKQLLGTFEPQPQGIATLSQAASPLSFRYTDQLYPQYGTTDMGYAIGPYGNADTISGVPTYGYAIQPSATPDSFLGSGFSGTTDIGYPFAPANRLGGLDLERFQGVSELGRQDEDVEQVKYLPGQEPKGIGKLMEFLGNIPTPFNILRKILSGQGIRNLNARIQGSDFGQSRTLQEYMMRRRERKQAERAQQAAPSVYQSAKEQGFTNDRGGFSTSRADRAGTSLGSGQFSSKTSRGRQGY
jgi:hypothetical protein